MRNTGIQWCDDTTNPTSGCDGCELYQPAGDPDKWTCYAQAVHENRLAHSFPQNYAFKFKDVRLIPGRLQKAANWTDLRGKDRPEKPWLNGRPRLVFISDMSDALSELVPFDYLLHEIVRPVMAWQRRGHVGLWLTKRPERMALFAEWLESQGFSWPENLVAGTSVTSQPTADRRIPALLRVPAKWRFVSFEPLRMKVEVRCYMPDSRNPSRPAIHWAIVGGESGARAMPFNVEHARSIVMQCRDTGCVPFVKQMGVRPYSPIAGSPFDAIGGGGWDSKHEGDTFLVDANESRYYPILADSHGGDWSEWRTDLRVREVPFFGGEFHV